MSTNPRELLVVNEAKLATRLTVRLPCRHESLPRFGVYVASGDVRAGLGGRPRGGLHRYLQPDSTGGWAGRERATGRCHDAVSRGPGRFEKIPSRLSELEFENHPLPRRLSGLQNC